MTLILKDTCMNGAPGRASAGSQRQIQTAINDHPELLNLHIATALGIAPRLNWVSPSRADAYREYRDADFLRALGLSRYQKQLATFWPSRGPRWDALACVGNGEGIVLLEAKSYVDEMYSSGCQASSDASLEKIRSATARAKHWLDVDAEFDWLGCDAEPGSRPRSLYQSANRIAHLYFFREILGVPAWLVNVCFVGDPHSPTTEEEWRRGLWSAKQALGIGHVRFAADVLLPSFD